MKTIFLSIVTLLTVCWYANAQTNTFPATGNAGVGTSSPRTNFEVNTGSATGGTLLIANNGTAGTVASPVYLHTDFAGYNFANYGPLARIEVRDRLYSYMQGDINFLVRNSNDVLTSAMFIDGIAGNIGIGTTTPSSLLHLQSTNAPLITLDKKGVITWKLGNFDQSTDNGFAIGFNTTKAFYITSTGLVGIGTITPASTFQVKGDARFGTNGTYTDLRLLTDSAFSSYYQTNSLTPVTIPGSGTATAVLHLKNGTGGGTTRIDLVVDGNVGIGVTKTPTNKLDVNGTIHAKQINVDLNNWSDYVFQKSYRLMPLGSLQSYISLYRHLPGIPSEQQVSENGVNLGEMENMLLKKIEELTLYLIDADKKAKEQQIEIDTQKKRLEALEERIIRLENSTDKLPGSN